MVAELGMAHVALAIVSECTENEFACSINTDRDLCALTVELG